MNCSTFSQLLLRNLWIIPFIMSNEHVKIFKKCKFNLFVVSSTINCVYFLFGVITGSLVQCLLINNNHNRTLNTGATVPFYVSLEMCCRRHIFQWIYFFRCGLAKFSQNQMLRNAIIRWSIITSYFVENCTLKCSSNKAFNIHLRMCKFAIGVHYK